MRAVIQRVREASVTVNGERVGEIGHGLCVLIGAGKIAGLRIFTDEADKMNLSVLDVGGGVLAISQFTLYGDARKGRRPSFVAAGAPEPAEALCEQVVQRLREHGVARVETGRFRSHMQVSLTNDGPVTILLDSDKTF